MAERLFKHTIVHMFQALLSLEHCRPKILLIPRFTGHPAHWKSVRHRQRVNMPSQPWRYIQAMFWQQSHRWRVVFYPNSMVLIVSIVTRGEEKIAPLGVALSLSFSLNLMDNPQATRNPPGNFYFVRVHVKPCYSPYVRRTLFTDKNTSSQMGKTYFINSGTVHGACIQNVYGLRIVHYARRNYVH